MTIERVALFDELVTMGLFATTSGKPQDWRRFCPAGRATSAGTNQLATATRRGAIVRYAPER